MSSAVANPQNGSFGGIPLPVVVSVSLLALTVAGGGWTLFQSQFSSLDKAIEQARKTSESAILLQRSENATAINELKSQIVDLHLEIRHDILSQNEFKQFEARVDVLQKRLDVIEATRPTTGELQATEATISKRLDDLSNRIETVERRALQK